MVERLTSFLSLLKVSFLVCGCLVSVFIVLSKFVTCLSLSHRLRKKELQTFVENQLQDKDRKPESGVTEGLVERQKQTSSLIEMFQQEALNEKQTRLLAQLKALEKVCFELLLNM